MEWKKLILISSIAFLVNLIIAFQLPTLYSDYVFLVVILISLAFGFIFYYILKKMLKLEFKDLKQLFYNVLAIWIFTTILSIILYLITPYFFTSYCGGGSGVQTLELTPCMLFMIRVGVVAALGVHNFFTLLISFYLARKYLKW